MCDARRRVFARCARRLPRIASHATSLLLSPAPPALQSRPRAPHLHPLGIPSHFPACLQEFFSLTLSLPLPPSQALGGRWCAGCPPCEALRSPPPGSPPALVGGSDTFSSQKTRMHFVLLRGLHVLPSRAGAVSSAVCARRRACRSARAAVGACCRCTFVSWCIVLRQFPMYVRYSFA